MAEITRLFSSSLLEISDVLRFSEEEEHHLYNVLRACAGDKLEVVDGAERLFVAALLKGREAKIVEERCAEGDDGKGVTLYQAVPKGRHMDLVVEKATELGAARIVPLSAERSVVRLTNGKEKVRRWSRVAEAAARQSLRLRVPEVGEVVPFSEAVREVGEAGVILHKSTELSPLEDEVPLPTVGLFVGPEGGWSDAELTMAREHGLRVASLGPYRLRSETAGIVAVARACAVLGRTRSVGRSQ